MSQSWIERAEAAMRGEAQPGIELLPHGRPALLDAVGRRALAAPFAAAFLWAGAIFAEGRAHPLDPLALLLRLLALAATLRALVALGLLAGRIREMRRQRSYQLALADDGLLLRTPQADYAVPRQDIAGICEPGHWGERSALRWSDVYVITRPESGRLFFAIPPLIERTPGVLAERLMRWRGVTAHDPDAERLEPAAVELPSKLFDAVASGEQPVGIAAIPHGRGYLKRGPYATVLLGAAILDGLLRSPPAMRERLGAAAPAVLALCLLVVPMVWLLQARRSMAARKGLALLLTPGELLLRTRAGVQRVRWSQVQRVEVVTRNAWSILQGAHASRTLLVQRKDGETLSYAELFLGVPAEVAAALCDAYRKGTLP